MKKNKQQGVGLVEVLVALVILALAVLGFVATQVKAIDTSREAIQRAAALNILDSLANAIRVNVSIQKVEYDAQNTAANTVTTENVLNAYKSKFAQANLAKKNCTLVFYQVVGNDATGSTYCAYDNLAYVDVASAQLAAESYGMRLAMDTCAKTQQDYQRQCLYAMWDKTKTITECVDSDGNYVKGSTCMMLEAF